MFARHRLAFAMLSLAVALLGAACSDSPKATGSGGAGGAGAAGAGGGAGTAVAAPAPAGFAVLNTDFSATSVSLLNTNGELVKADCIHTTLVNGTATVSGDVSLPSQPQRGGQLVLIDRGNTALTFIKPEDCSVARQISVKGGFNRPNPHDVVILADDKAYVTRFEKNLDSTEPTTAGDDLLIIDPRDGTVTGHIDLSPYAVAVADTTIQARPDRALIAGGKVVVSLNEADAKFYAYGEGHLVVVDPATDAVTQDLALTGFKGCEGMTYLADTKLLLVVCGGSFGADPAADSGIALVDLSGDTAVLTKTISAAAFDDHAASFQAISATVAGGTRRAFINAFGAFASTGSDAVPDGAYVVDLDSGAATRFASSTAYDLGAAALLGTTLLLPDGSKTMPRLRLFDVSAAPTETGAFVTDATSGLPPRSVAAY